MTSAAIAGRKIRYGTGSPVTYNDVEEVTEISGFGATAELIDVTNYDSNGSKEYIGGLSDGVEFSITCNDVPSATRQAALLALAAGVTVQMQYAKTDQSPDLTYSFAAVYLGYEEAPSTTEQNQITFNFKITGAITAA